MGCCALVLDASAIIVYCSLCYYISLDVGLCFGNNVPIRVLGMIFKKKGVGFAKDPFVFP